MRFRLVGQMKYEKGDVGNERRFGYAISDIVFAESLEQAIRLSRAFIENHKQRLLNTEAQHIDAITATLSDENGTACFKFELVKEHVLIRWETREEGNGGIITRTERIKPEHIAEEYI